MMISRALPRTLIRHHGSSSSKRAISSMNDLFNPTETHSQLRSMLRDFVRNEVGVHADDKYLDILGALLTRRYTEILQVEPQANEYNRQEKLNVPLLRQLGDLGLFGLTVEEQYGGSGLDATSVVLAHEELSYSDPALCLSYLAHSLLLVGNS